MLHQFLSEHRDEIVQRCEQTYRTRHPERTPEELLDTIPSFIDEIIKAERRTAGLPEVSTLPEHADEEAAHAERRFKSGFALRDLCADYATISQVIGEIAEVHAIELDARSYRVLNACVDAGVARAIEHYFALSLERSEQEVAQWLGSLAHELRNAIGSAILAYDYLRTGRVGLHSKTARVLERSLNRLEGLVSQTLAAVQLKSGVAPAREPIDLGELVDDVVASALHERGITVLAEVEPGLSVIGDARLIGSALTNLFQNALKFTRSAGRVRIAGDRQGGGARIAVEDECGGLAVAPEALFAPFAQGGPARRRGIGLGLTISRQAIEAHHGRIDVTNRPGRGCVFSIWVPERG